MCTQGGFSASPSAYRIGKKENVIPQPFRARGLNVLFIISTYWIHFSCLGYFTLVSPLGVLVDMHNRYLSFRFLARNIKFICLFRPSKSALLQGELAKLMCDTMVSCFLAQSCSKNLVLCRYMASIRGFVRWGDVTFFPATSLHACSPLCRGHIMLPHLSTLCLVTIGCMLLWDSMRPKLYVVSRNI
jgi:hypothetical protein